MLASSLARFSLSHCFMRLDHTHAGPGTSTCSLEHHELQTLSHEVCPLCLSRYAPEDEAICIACEAPSCPDCAHTLPGTKSVLCYACPVPTKH